MLEYRGLELCSTTCAAIVFILVVDSLAPSKNSTTTPNDQTINDTNKSCCITTRSQFYCTRCICWFFYLPTMICLSHSHFLLPAFLFTIRHTDSTITSRTGLPFFQILVILQDTQSLLISLDTAAKLSPSNYAYS